MVIQDCHYQHSIWERSAFWSNVHRRIALTHDYSSTSSSLLEKQHTPPGISVAAISSGLPGNLQTLINTASYRISKEGKFLQISNLPAEQSGQRSAQLKPNRVFFGSPGADVRFPVSGVSVPFISSPAEADICAQKFSSHTLTPIL